MKTKNLELVTNALICLLQAQPALLALIPAMGHIPGFINNLSNVRNESIPKSCLSILHQLADSPPCIDSMVQSKSILSQIYLSIKTYDTLIDVACETLDKLFKTDNEELVHQAIKVELIQYLLNLLDSNKSIHSSSTKAHIVQVLKSMLNNSTYGQQVNAVLNNSSVWSEYKDQRHDLFITNTTFAGYITGKTRYILLHYLYINIYII